MRTHHLKTWPTPFQGLKRGEKTFEIRKNDRDFAVGDILVLEEYDPQSETYSGDSLVREVSYLLTATPDEFFGVKAGYCVMAVR